MTNPAAIQKIEQAAAENATKLDKSSLDLTEVPPEIALLVNLQTLDLSSNKISVIPDSIVQLVNLQKLDLRYNQISSIPDSIAQLLNLQMFILRENPINNVPPEIIEQEPQTIFAYLKATTKRPLNELKVLLVGEGDVGKTSLFKSLQANPSMPKNAKPLALISSPGTSTKTANPSASTFGTNPAKLASIAAAKAVAIGLSSPAKKKNQVYSQSVQLCSS
jgi:Leucine-rich repeat (LRR) protein